MSERIVNIPIEGGGFYRRQISTLSANEATFLQETFLCNPLVPEDRQRYQDSAKRLWEANAKQ